MVKNILYCEDHPGTANTVSQEIRMAFVMQNPNILLAKDETEALRHLADNSLDLVVTDGILAGKSTGWGVAYSLRARKYDGPIIYAGTCTTDIPQGSEGLFVQPLLHKPFNRELESAKNLKGLLDLIGKCLGYD